MNTGKQIQWKVAIQLTLINLLKLKNIRMGPEKYFHSIINANKL
jgi:hypothetical protein